MYRNFIFKHATEALPHLLEALHVHGEEVGSRAGRVKELTHVGITLTEPWKRELLVPLRKPNLAAQIAETVWILGGRNDIGWLSHYLPRAADFSDDGHTWRGGYGPRLRAWDDHGHAKRVDQVAEVFRILSESPASRQAVMSIWDPASDYEPSKDIPCNNWLSWSSRLGKLDLHVAIRSNDAMWGWSGINAFEWSALQEVMAGLLGLQVGGLHFSTTSFHLYDRHWDRAKRITDAYHNVGLGRELDSPRFKVHERDAAHYADRLQWFYQCVEDWFAIEKGLRHGESMDQAVEDFPEPMLQSWLRVLQWWWTGEREYLAPLEGTRLELAAHMSVQPPERERVSLYSEQSPEPVLTLFNDGSAEIRGTLQATSLVIEDPEPSEFLDQLRALHLEKEAAYGGSWKKRGEILGIMANIARKVDRLAGGETDDETSADTAGDLFVYLAKYRTWLSDQGLGKLSKLEDLSDYAQHANTYMEGIEREMDAVYGEQAFNAAGLAATLTSDFDVLEREVMGGAADRYELVDSMAKDAYLLARLLWEGEKASAAERFALRDAALQGGDEYRGADVD